MANTLGYITGALSALALATAVDYAWESPKGAHDSIKDVQSTLVRELKRPKGYIGEGNLLEVIADASHDVGQANFSEAWNQLNRIDVGFGNTPLQDQRLRSSHYENARDFGEYLNDEMEEHWALSDYAPSYLKRKGGLALGGLGLLAGLLGAAAIAGGKK